MAEQIVLWEEVAGQPVESFVVCLRCGRVLSSPVSKRRGFGPVCWGKILAAGERRRQEEEVQE